MQWESDKADFYLYKYNIEAVQLNNLMVEVKAMHLHLYLHLHLQVCNICPIQIN